LFDRMDAAYREKVLGNDCVRIAIEAGSSFGWERYVGVDGTVIGVTGFGVSAPAERVYEHFGITAVGIADAAAARLRG
jgi:transketolase